MKLFNLIRPRRPVLHKTMETEWSAGWTARDWADLPPYHPQADDIRR